MAGARISATFVLSLLVLASPSFSQTEDDLRRQGYVFGAPGALMLEGTATTLELGGGMQWLVHRGLGLGFDASFLAGPECFECGVMEFGSLDLSYHFVPGSRDLVRFVLAGVGGATDGEGSAMLMNLGGGVNYWFENGMALRLALRNRLDSDATIRAVGFRIGITF